MLVELVNSSKFETSFAKFLNMKHLFTILICCFLTNLLLAQKTTDPNREDWKTIFNGKDLTGWDIKISGQDINDNYKNNIVVEDGLFRVNYKEFKTFQNKYGHIYYRQPYSHYKIRFAYRFLGEQVPEAETWNVRNSGIMLHSQAAWEQGREQYFPYSLEMQLLGGLGKGPRHTGNLCTPGTVVHMRGKLDKAHCIDSDSKTYEGDQWVQAEAIMLGDSLAYHLIEGDTVLQFTKFQVCDTSEIPFIKMLKASNADADAWAALANTPLKSGYIALQAESHAIDFKNIELLDLTGCMDKKASNYKSYFVNNDPSSCRYTTDNNVTTPIKTESGLVTGRFDGEVRSFKDLPFAAAPIGDLRWKAPKPAPKWSKTLDCAKYGPSAIQTDPLPFMMWTEEFMAPRQPLSEDCLNLNIWTAAKNAEEKRPVIVWIHGGGFVSGSGSAPLYDGTEMAKKGVVFVSINYRLGVFGFMAHPDLSKESAHNSSGNYAILDQIAALEWVKNNIAAFGGDPTRVTIAGQSAGAFSVNALVISPLAKGLFHRAIAQSGGSFSQKDPQMDLKTLEKQGVALANKVGAKSLADLRKMSATDLLNAATDRFYPCIDGYVMTANTATTFKEKRNNDVPVLTGWNAGDLFPANNPMNAKDFKADAKKKYGKLSKLFLKLYPAKTEAQVAESQMQLTGNRLFAWQNYKWAQLQAEKGQNKAYLYYFSHVPPQNAGQPDYGAFHSAEFGYALHTLHLWKRPFVAADKTLEEQMSSYWVNFATIGDPNGIGLPRWEAFDGEKKQVMEFGEKAVLGGLPMKEKMDFWDNYEGF
jgi:para-nitrobenzyl esterase